MQEEAPRYLLIVREWLRPGTDAAYHENELEIATACATLECPHPYLALAPVTGPRVIWWLNAFTSAEERDGVERAYASNERLVAALDPLGRRKEGFREALTTTMTEHRPESSHGAVLRIAGARFLVVGTTVQESEALGAVFEASDGERFVVASAPTLEAAERIGAEFGSGATLLAVQPPWSYPALEWVDSDPDFWSPSPGARRGGIGEAFPRLR